MSSHSQHMNTALPQQPLKISRLAPPHLTIPFPAKLVLTPFMIESTLAKVFGTKHDREIKRIQPMVAAINALEPELQKLSDQDLAAKTIDFKQRVSNGAPLDDMR